MGCGNRPGPGLGDTREEATMGELTSINQSLSCLGLSAKPLEAFASVVKDSVKTDRSFTPSTG